MAVFDVYDESWEDKKAVAVRFMVQAMDHTLTESEINALIDGILQNVSSKLGGVLRS